MSDCEASSLLAFTKLSSIRFEEIECKTLNKTLIQQRMAHLADAECWKTISRQRNNGELNTHGVLGHNKHHQKHNSTVY